MLLGRIMLKKYPCYRLEFLFDVIEGKVYTDICNIQKDSFFQYKGKECEVWMPGFVLQTAPTTILQSKLLMSSWEVSSFLAYVGAASLALICLLWSVSSPSCLFVMQLTLVTWPLQVPGQPLQSFNVWLKSCFLAIPRIFPVSSYLIPLCMGSIWCLYNNWLMTVFFTLDIFWCH